MRALIYMICFAITYSDAIDVPDVPEYSSDPNKLIKDDLDDKASAAEGREYQDCRNEPWCKNKENIPVEEERRYQRSLDNSSQYNSEPIAEPPQNESFWCNNSAQTSMEDKMIELRIEMVKFQILSQLGLKNPPPAVERPSRSAKEMIQTLMDLGDMEIESGERLAIHATNDDIFCTPSDGTYCRVFNFEIHSVSNSSTISLWIYRADGSPSNNLLISLSCWDSEERYANEKFLEEIIDYGWIEAQFPESLLLMSWNDTFFCSVEVSGQKIEDQGDHRPFLMVTNFPEGSSRRRREISCDSNERCCLKPLSKTFTEIGFDFVVYPYRVELNMCVGKCRPDPRTNSPYQTAMMAALEKNHELRDSLGACASFCCKPKVLEPVMIFYNDSEGLLDQANITDLTVVACGCT